MGEGDVSMKRRGWRVILLTHTATAEYVGARSVPLSSLLRGTTGACQEQRPQLSALDKLEISIRQTVASYHDGSSDGSARRKNKTKKNDDRTLKGRHRTRRDHDPQ